MLSEKLRVPKIVLCNGSPKSQIGAQRLPKPRLFTHNSQLLLVSRLGVRPQLPFLHSTAGGILSPTVPRSQLRHQLARLLTTESKLYLKDQLWKGAKYTVYGWMVFFLLAVMGFGFQNEILERNFPSPPDWSMISRFTYRCAKNEENPDSDSMGYVDWASVGNRYHHLIKRLENPAIDGQGLRPILQDEGDIYVAGVGKAGLDTSAKSEPWRRGYFDCLMSFAKAAENMNGWVRDTTRDIAFPPDVVIGPSNPRPRPVPYGAASAPMEENCIPAFEPPATYYLKVLNTQGFSTRQRLDAALAYADWLEFKGLPSTAEDMYEWGLDIAMGALPVGVNDVIDVKSGVINSEATHVSSNILLASTALAIHHARNNNIAAALPIFVSVLRARRKLSSPTSSPVTKPKVQDQSSWSLFSSFIKSLLVTPPYPPAPPTGDDIAVRTRSAICEEAGVMSHIGEILFASALPSPTTKKPANTFDRLSVPSFATSSQPENQQFGLSWTRDAVDLAEANLISAEEDDEESHNKCSECLAVGLENWTTMVTKMLENERQATDDEIQKPKQKWFWQSSSDIEHEGRWERELKVVDRRLARVRRLLSKEADRKELRSGYHFL